MKWHEGFEQDEKGISRGDRPAIAWFQDPAGHKISVVSGAPDDKEADVKWRWPSSPP